MKFIDHPDNTKVTEKEIQYLYQTHPYLIEKKFLNQKVIPQYQLPSGYADIVVLLEDEAVVIELKVDSLEISHLLQLVGYLEDLKVILNKDKKVRGILIGKKPKCDLNASIKCLSFKIKVMILNKNLPIKIKICENCRLANDFNNTTCVYCSGNHFIKNS